jgi:hypothetical protein
MFMTDSGLVQATRQTKQQPKNLRNQHGEL